MEIDRKDLKDLIHFLLSREDDIALEEENFGLLKQIFKRLFGREPKSER